MATNDAANVAMHETVWLNANAFYDAERRYYEVSSSNDPRRSNPGHHNNPSVQNPTGTQSSLASEIAYARQKIQNFLKSADAGVDSSSCSLIKRMEDIEKEQENMNQELARLKSDVKLMMSKLSSFVNIMNENNQVKDVVSVPQKEESKKSVQNGSSAAAGDDDLNLFGSDEEDADAVKLREERLQQYANKKAKKPALVAKSSVVLDVKPWDDETDMKAMETAVREVKCDGLVWGASKLVPLAYGIKKLQIVCIVEDDKVSIDWLQETISDIEDLVQSVDIAAFNKL